MRTKIQGGACAAPDGGAAASYDAPAGTTVDTERAALHAQAVAWQATHKTDFLTAYKAVGGK